MGEFVGKPACVIYITLSIVRNEKITYKRAAKRSEPITPDCRFIGALIFGTKFKPFSNVKIEILFVRFGHTRSLRVSELPGTDESIAGRIPR